MKPKETKNMINRAKYKEIKKYDHRQLEEFLRAFYAEAYKDGLEAAGSQQNNNLTALFTALESGELKGVKGATVGKIKEFAAEKGWL
jgi:flagellar biosynthesis/type III secretory pathway protein FliH